MENKHTNGPWSISFLGERYFITVDVANGKRAVAMLPVDAINPNANARLIAAAPEMLNALKLAESGILSIRAESDDDGLADIHDAIKLAIARAEGK